MQILMDPIVVECYSINPKFSDGKNLLTYYQKLSAQSKQIKTRGSEDFLKSANQKQEL
jgi:hypothetical protein